MTRRIYTLLLCLLLAVAHGASEERQLNILAANDMHATIEAFPQLAAIADSLRTLDPALLVFSAGDNRTGNPLNDKYEIPGYPMVALMNAVGFNASAVGNHEFDVRSLPRLIGLSAFRYLCANLEGDSTSGLRVEPCQVFDAGGVKVGVVGAIQLSPQGIPSTHPDNLVGVTFSDARDVVPRYEWLRSECDVTILLSHLGVEADVEMAALCPWLDLIIGGHTHTPLKWGRMENGVLITQNKNKLPQVTHITLTLRRDNAHEPWTVVDKRAESIDVKTFGSRNKVVEAMVQHFSDNLEFRRVLAQADAPFDRREELGCMMCDAFMDEYGADIGVQNPGGVRMDSHPAGDITMLDVLQMDPFDNNAVVMELTGDELLEMMLSYCHHNLHSFPFVGGMRCEITQDPDDLRKVKSVRLLNLDGTPLNMRRRYRVVTNSYIAATSNLPKGRAHVLNNQTTDLITHFLVKNGSVNYQGVSRLKLAERTPKE